ncbi:(S)-2-haloacid dehalogenase 4A [Moorella humiferrea]|uniref:HAD family hydrolase n=1 Tax=Neomoorella humiferrea TaxID=676965 RepID=UPI0030CFF028
MNTELSIKCKRKIRAVTFDAYGTLFNIEGLHSRATELILQHNSFAADAASFHRLWDEHTDELIKTDKFDKLWNVFDRALDMTFRDFGFQGKRKPGDLEIWLRLIENCSIYPDAPLVVETAARHFKTALISNTDNHELSVALARCELRFNAVVTSENARAYKPSPEIFQQAADILECRPEEILHVGDSYNADVVGAKNFGAAAVWLNRKKANIPNPRVQPDFQIENLKEMLEVLRYFLDEDKNCQGKEGLWEEIAK